jgi:hypothetical protein
MASRRFADAGSAAGRTRRTIARVRVELAEDGDIEWGSERLDAAAGSAVTHQPARRCCVFTRTPGLKGARCAR